MLFLLRWFDALPFTFLLIKSVNSRENSSLAFPGDVFIVFGVCGIAFLLLLDDLLLSLPICSPSLQSIVFLKSMALKKAFYVVGT